MSLSHTTRTSGNATGLSTASLTRRSALRGSAAAAVALAAGVTTALPAAAAPDAELIALSHRLQDLFRAEHEAWTRHSEAEDASYLASPEAPTRPEVKGAYAELDTLPQEQRLAKLFAGPTEFWAASAAVDAEHKAAMAEYERTVAAIERRHGVHRLEREARRASEEVAAASARLAEMRATTPRGVAAKAVTLLPVAGPDTVLGLAELEQHLALLGSLLEDAARIGMGAVS